MKLTYMIIKKEDLANFKAACSITPKCNFNSEGESKKSEEIVVWFNIDERTELRQGAAIFNLGRNFENLAWAEQMDEEMAEHRILKK